MPDQTPFEARLADAYARYVAAASVAVDPRIVAATVAAGSPSRSLGWPNVFTLGRRVAVAAVIAVVAVGGAFYLLRPSQPSIGGPSPAPGASASPTEQASPSELAIPSTSARAASWTATGSMATPHGTATATLLRDGKVLVMYYSRDRNKHPAELYDPTTGSWTATGSTLGGQWGVTLLDGRVLAGGGMNGDGSVASAELYDPGTGSWTKTGSMVAQGGEEAVTLLLDGRVLAAGGPGNYDARTGWGGTRAAELYDPASGRWTVTGSMITPRTGPTATLLRDGKVLVAGGEHNGELASAELYDPATGTWTATGAMSRPLFVRVPAALLRDGSVLVAEFAPAATPCAARTCPLVFVAELYDPVTGTWTATESTATPRYFGYTATLLPDGMLLVAGGADSSSEGYGLLASAELYDPGTGSWTATATMSVARAGHTATLLRDGRVLVTSGEGGGTSAELYDPGSP